MMDIALNPQTHDLDIVTFDLYLIDGIDQIAQNLNITLRFFLGEWYLDTLVGIPYYQYILIKNPNQIQVDSFLMDAIYDTPGIQNITAYSSAYNGNTRQYNVNFTASTIDGETEIEVLLP